MLYMPMLPLPLSGPRRLNFTVREISGRYDRRRFVRFAARLYRDDRYRPPDVISQRSSALDEKKNPILARIPLGLFMAESRTLDDVVGTVAVWVDDRSDTSPSAQRVGHFGMFEVINEEEVAASLLESAEKWVLEHLPGAEGLRGPFDLDPCRSPGLLVDGYNRKPGVLMPYNPPYYAGLIESAGCKASTELLAYRLDLSSLKDSHGAGAAQLQTGALALRASHDLVIRDVSGQADWRTILPETVQDLPGTTWHAGPESPELAASELLFYLKRIAGWHSAGIILVARAGENGNAVAFGVAVPNAREPALVTLGKRLTSGWLGGMRSAYSVANVPLSGLVSQLPTRRASSEGSPHHAGQDSSLSWRCGGAYGTEPLRMTPRGHSAPGKVRAEQGIIFRAVRKAGIRLLPAIVRTDSRDRRVEELLLSELLMLAADQGYAQAEISPVPAVDTATRDMLAALGADPSKTYAIYEKRF